MSPPRIIPTVSRVRMGQHGYWIADVNLAPGRTVSVMLAVTGISPDEAGAYALLTLTGQVRGISS